MPDPEKQWYELLKHNFDHPDRDTTEVIHTVRGLGRAELMSSVLTDRLSPEERAAGFSVYLRLGKAPGVDLRKRKHPPTQRNRRR